jgi:N-ethylmaleimide reductase
MPSLFDTYQLADLSLKNRVVLAPMTRARTADDRVPTPLMVEYYRQRANAGLMLTEATVISEIGNGWNHTPGIYNETQLKGWKPIVEAIHQAESKVFLQLWHCGRASHQSFHPHLGLPVAPSAIAINDDYIHTPDGKQPHQIPRPLTVQEITATVEDYRQGAVRAKEAGFDGVEIHGANGYLIDQFLQSKTNQRTDAYGGSLENRFRFLHEVTEAVSTVFPSQRVGVRLSPNGVYNDMGSPDYREAFPYFAQRLNAYNLAYLHIVDGLAFGFHDLGEPLTLADFRAVYSGTLMGNCGYTQATAEKAIAAGNADLIAFGRPYISNPDLVQRFANGWALAPDPDPTIWNGTEGDYSTGYTDFPAYRS